MDIKRGTILTPDAIKSIITNRTRECIHPEQKPSSMEWFLTNAVDNDEMSIIIELYCETRGLLFYDEWIYKESFDDDDSKDASYTASKLLNHWFSKSIPKIRQFDAMMKNAQIVPFLGFGVEPLGRMLVGFFIPFDTLSPTNLTKRTLRDLWDCTIGAREESVTMRKGHAKCLGEIDNFRLIVKDDTMPGGEALAPLTKETYGTIDLLLGECECGYHFTVDATFVEQVGGFTFECPACSRIIDTKSTFPGKDT